MQAKDIMCKNIFYASYDDSMIRCASILKENNIGFLPIIKDGKVVGVITDRDLCIRGITDEANFHNPVENIITRQIITVSVDDSLTAVCQVMEKYRIKRVLVHQHQKIVGVISFSDLLRAEIDSNTLLHVLQNIFNIDHVNVIEEPKVDEFYL